ncbi:hypothetical protein [Flavobacterium caeni]|uniref:Lipocalin-like domain-containing protein n=1 Tax=Flavobacterium caeni TaxID=490189 RepID=A0A1G5AMW7_9FLAO|nr:hypothetical protein [Flavobacterium caeni]SCX79231.1 hypothetical protein SAMN02927903_00077 [Flavobacterium caeni]
MKKWLFLCVVGVLGSCGKKVEMADVPKMNGYWEIQKVVLPDGSEKDYKINPVFDYFEIKDGRGIRKKVMPQFNGKYLVNDLSEAVKVVAKGQKIYLAYTTPYAKWQEELVSLTDSTMVVANEEEKEYHYKKTAALDLTHVQKTP